MSATIATPNSPAGAGSSPSSLLGSSGFIFLDDRPWPYLVTDQSGEWWLCYWRDSTKQFATLRKLEFAEVERFRPHALPPEQAALYLPNSRMEFLRLAAKSPSKHRDNIP